MSDKLQVIQQLFSNLTETETETEKAEFLDYLKGKKTDRVSSFNSLKEIILKNNKSNLEDRPCCPHCKGLIVVKYGFKEGKQRFKCKECKKTFL